MATDGILNKRLSEVTVGELLEYLGMYGDAARRARDAQVAIAEKMEQIFSDTEQLAGIGGGATKLTSIQEIMEWAVEHSNRYRSEVNPREALLVAAAWVKL